MKTIEVKPSGSTSYISLGLVQAGDNISGVTVTTSPWQPGDAEEPFRMPLHPFNGGLNFDKISESTTYAKSNADASNENILLFPPKVTTLELTDATAPNKIVNFNGAVYVLGGRYVYEIDTSYNVVEDQDFGVGNAGVDMVIFNNELIVAMGETEKIWKRDNAGVWTQASDDTYAIALGVVGSFLWRAYETNKVASCLTTPLSLTSWVGGDTVGDTSYSINTIIDYGGVPWVGKADGLYVQDTVSGFLNQVPQLRQRPDTNNCKGAFTGWASLWVPSITGLYRVRAGYSEIRGPELTYRPDYRFIVRGGVEFNNALYLLVNDINNDNLPFICKVIKDDFDLTRREYIYHELVRLTPTTDYPGYCIGLSTDTDQPTLFASSGDIDLHYFILSRGGGRDIDDEEYLFGTSMELETGIFKAGIDRSVLVQPVGVEVVCNFSRIGDSLVVSGSVDGEGYINLLDSIEYAGTAEIQLTDGVETVYRFFPQDTEAHHIEIKFTGTQQADSAGLDRAEIYEAYCFGYIHPKHKDVITVNIVNDDVSNKNGYTASQINELFHIWRENGTLITAKLDGYKSNQPFTCVIASVQEVEIFTTMRNEINKDVVSLLEVKLVRFEI